jgi:hypothetical protein
VVVVSPVVVVVDDGVPDELSSCVGFGSAGSGFVPIRTTFGSAR